MDFLDKDKSKVSGTLAALTLAGAALGIAPGAQAAESGYASFADFATKNKLKTDGSENAFFNQTEKLAAIIRVVPDATDSKAGRLQTTIVHSGYAQIYELEERIKIGADGKVQSNMTGSGRSMQGRPDRELYKQLLEEFNPAQKKSSGYDTPIGQAIQEKGYGIGGSASPAGDYHKIVDPANRTYAKGSCLTISDMRALCTTGFYLDDQSEYRFRVEMFQKNAGQVTRSATDINRQYDSDSERNMVQEHKGDRTGVLNYVPKS